MAEITLTLRDTPAGGVSIQSSFKPAVGRSCTPAQAQALDLHRDTLKAWPAGSVGTDLTKLYQAGAPNKEQVYDEQIEPLMTQIIAICQLHGIAMLADFEIPTIADEDLLCTSILPDELQENSMRHNAALRALASRTLIAAIAKNQAAQQTEGALP